MSMQTCVHMCANVVHLSVQTWWVWVCVRVCILVGVQTQCMCASRAVCVCRSIVSLPICRDTAYAVCICRHAYERVQDMPCYQLIPAREVLGCAYMLPVCAYTVYVAGI